jgi:hypothetical protein
VIAVQLTALAKKIQINGCSCCVLVRQYTERATSCSKEM